MANTQIEWPGAKRIIVPATSGLPYKATIATILNGGATSDIDKARSVTVYSTLGSFGSRSAGCVDMGNFKVRVPCVCEGELHFYRSTCCFRSSCPFNSDRYGNSCACTSTAAPLHFPAELSYRASGINCQLTVCGNREGTADDADGKAARSLHWT